MPEDRRKKEFAPGIEDRHFYGDPKSLSPSELVPFVIQRHEALRAGPHYDVRLGKKKMLSWATRKLPEPGEKVLAIQQSAHCFIYGTHVATNCGWVQINAIKHNIDMLKVPCVVERDGTKYFEYFDIKNFWERTYNHIDEGPLYKIIYRISPSSIRSVITCTGGHAFYSRGDKILAKDLKVGTLIDYVDPVPNSVQRQILLGLILNGAPYNKHRCNMRIYATKDKLNYIRWLAAAIRPFIMINSAVDDAYYLNIKLRSLNYARYFKIRFKLDFDAITEDFTLLTLATMFQHSGIVHLNKYVPVKLCIPLRRMCKADANVVLMIVRSIAGVPFEMRFVKDSNKISPLSRCTLVLENTDDIYTFYKNIVPYINADSSSLLKGYTADIDQLGANLPDFDKLRNMAIVAHTPVLAIKKIYGRPRRNKVYNLEVAEVHKYLVGDNILVGNSESYKTFTGTLPAGYGAGKVYRHDLGEVLITESNPSKIKFVIAHKDMPEEFTLVRIKGKDGKKPAWLMINTTPVEGVDWEKPHFKLIKANDIDKFFDSNYTAAAKVDGALGILDLLKDKIRIMSYRKYKETGYPIVHTQRFGIDTSKIKIPKDLQNYIALGEIYGERGGKAISAAELGGLLNATIANSRRKQQEQNIRLKMMLFDIINKVDKNEKLTRDQKRELLNKLINVLPAEYFSVVEEAATPEAKRKLYNRIIKGEDPLTREGIVFYPPGGETPLKYKVRPEYDVYIRRILPGEGKYKGKAAGGFEYSLTPDGPIVGKVGTGFSDQERRDMLVNADKYIGRLARVTAQEQFESGALRAPSYIARHEDYNVKSSAYILGKLIKQVFNDKI